MIFSGDTVAEQKKMSFTGSVSILALSSLAVQGVSILAVPITSRLFAPEAFGLSAAFLSIAGIVANVASMRYEQAILLPREEHDAIAVFSLGFVITTVLSLLTALTLYLFGDTLFVLGKVPELIPYMWMLPIIIYCTGTANLFNHLMLRFGAFTGIGGARIASRTGQAGAAIGFGAAGWSTAGYLILSSIVSPALETLWYVFMYPARILKALRAGSIIADMKRLASEYRKFPLFSLWSDLLNVASQSIPVIMVTAFYGARASGFYSRAMALVTVPFFFLSTSIRDVFFQRAGALVAEGGDIRELLDTVSKRLLQIILLPMLMAAVIGTDIFVVVAGDRWLEAGVYTRLLVPWLLISFVAFPVSVMFPIMNLQDIQLWYNIALFIARIAVLSIAGVMTGSPAVAVFLFSAVGAVFNAWAVAYILRKNELSLAGFAGTGMLYFLYALPATLMTAAGKWLLGFSPVVNIACGCVFSGVTLLAMMYGDRDFRQFVTTTVRSLKKG